MLKIEKDKVNKKVFIKGLNIKNINNVLPKIESNYVKIMKNNIVPFKAYLKSELFFSKLRNKNFKIMNYLSWITNQKIIGLCLIKAGRNLGKFKTKARTSTNIIKSGSISNGIVIQKLLKRRGGINNRKLIITTK